MESRQSASDLPPTVESLEQDLGSLRLSVQVALVSLVILSGAIGLYLFRQVSLLRRQAEFTQRTAQQMASNYNFNLATQAVDFERQLLEFAKSHPDLQTRLTKFFPGTAAGSTPSSSVPPSSVPPSLTPPAGPAPTPTSTPAPAPK